MFQILTSVRLRTSNARSCVRIRMEDTTVNVILDFIWKLIRSHVQVNKVLSHVQVNKVLSHVPVNKVALNG